MGFFFKAFTAMVAADAIDRHMASRPTRYWYPNRAGLPPPGTTTAYIESTAAPAPALLAAGPPAAVWDSAHPERPT